MFKNFFTTSAAIGTLALLSSCFRFDVDGPCRKASGPVQSLDLQLDAIDAIQFNGAGDLIIEYGPVQKVTVTAEKEVLDQLNFRVNSGRLVTDFRGCFRQYNLKVELTLPLALKDVKINGSGKAATLGPALQVAPEFVTDISGSGSVDFVLEPTDKLYARINGSGNVKLAGEANYMETRISGSGRVQAYDLSSVEHDITISGSGSVFVTCNNGPLNVLITGSGNVNYRGTPSLVNSRITGSGRVRNN